MKRPKFASLIRFSRVLSLSLLVVLLGGLLKPEAAAQSVSFGAPTAFGTGSNPQSLAVGDFNGDRKFDLATANVVSATVSILLGTGTGSFGAKTDFGTGSDPESIAVGDFNGDGKLDLAVANLSSNTISILLNACNIPPFIFDVCLQDDSSRGIVFLGNSQTGAYKFCCGGTVFTGVAQVTRRGNTVTFQDNSSDRRVLAIDDESVHKGKASLQSPPGSIKCTIADRNTANNSCSCQ